MLTSYPNHLNRRGAALIIALVLLAILGIVAGVVLPQVIRAKHEMWLDSVRTQSRQLLDDALRNADVKRQSESAFSGETLTLGSDVQPFSGTFQVTTRLENDVFAANVEYRDEQGKLIYSTER